MRRWDRPIASVACAIALLWPPAIAPARQAPARVTFLTNYVFQGRQAPFFLGRDKEFYREAGFDLTIVPATGSGFVISAIDSGKAEYGMAESASVVQAVARGAKVKGFAVFMDVSTSGLAALKPYPTLESIAGKPIAASLTDSARVILPVVFARAGLDAAGINWVATDPSVYFPLLLGGRVELMTASSDGDVPTLRRVADRRGQTVHFMPFAQWGYDVFGYFLVAHGARIGASEGQVRAFAAATARSVRYAIQHPEEAARSIARSAPALSEADALAQWRESIRAIDTAFAREHGYGQATEARLRATVALVSEALLLKPEPDAREVYAASFMTR